MARNKKKKVENIKPGDVFHNGLASAIGLNMRPFGHGQQVNQVDTLADNVRGYMTTNMRNLLAQTYAEIGLVQTVIDIPIDDALRGGLVISSDELDEADIKDLQRARVMGNDDLALAQSLKWNALYGGAGLVIANGGEHSEPLKLSDIKKGDPLEFIAADLWELNYQYYSQEEGDGLSKHDNAPSHYNFYGKKLDASRVIRFEGIEAPSFIRPRLSGWGLSKLECLVSGISQYLKANNLAFEVLDEFKLNIFKLKNLATSLAGGNEAGIHKRVQLANEQKSYQSAIVLDAEDDFQTKELSFAGIAEAMDGIRKQVASDMRIPMTKLFGISASGFNSGEDDIENYNGMIESSIRSKFMNQIHLMVSYRCQQVFGFVPDDLTIAFKPLRVMSSQQEEEVKTQQFNRLLQAYQAGLINDVDFREACNTDDLLPMRLDVESLGSGLNIDNPDAKLLDERSVPELEKKTINQGAKK